MCTMLSAKKNPVTFQSPRNYERELEYLYARKSAIDSLIASLEQYDRYREAGPPASGGQRKSA